MKLALPLLLFVTAGCVQTTGSLKLDAPGESRIKPADVILVRLSPETKTRNEPAAAPLTGKKNENIRWDTGEIWAKIFIGGADAPAEFSIIDSDLHFNIGGLGWTMRATYDVNGLLTFNGKEYPINVSGSRAAAIAVPSAERQAVELAVVAAAKQCKAIMAQAK